MTSKGTESTRDFFYIKFYYKAYQEMDNMRREEGKVSNFIWNRLQRCQLKGLDIFRLAWLHKLCHCVC